MLDEARSSSLAGGQAHAHAYVAPRNWNTYAGDHSGKTTQRIRGRAQPRRC
jgi:hypothetical protein